VSLRTALDLLAKGRDSALGEKKEERKK